MNFAMPVAGGVLIGIAAVWLYLSVGRIAGISGIAANALLQAKENLWSVFFMVGLGLGGWLAHYLLGTAPDGETASDQGLLLIVGGFVVGIGTRLGSGCTSGHGVCGLSRFSLRSLIATIIFVALGMLVASGLSLL
ncbi:MAG: YeeE/YedE thiosulfate transporter family protein [Pseudomonadota bacterium]|nr:YeeE/YedE thiosulfate transporter family protein [Pseudomonadota bacterium]